MADYLALGVYVEEPGARPRSIEPVGTSTAGFVGLATRGPIGAASPPLGSLGEFTRIYGDAGDLMIGGGAATNYLAYAVRAFFDNGGTRLYVVRVPGAGAAAGVASGGGVTLGARWPGGAAIPGSSANFRVTFGIESVATTKRIAVRQPPGTLVKVGTDLVVTSAAGEGAPSALDGLADDDAVTVLTLAVTVASPDGVCAQYAGLGFDPAHPRYACAVLAPTPPVAEDVLTNPVVMSVASEVDAASLYTTVSAQPVFDLVGGSDGTGPPSLAAWQEALDCLAALEDVAIIAAPGASSFPAPTPVDVSRALIAAAETPGAYRVAVLDAPPDLQPYEVHAFRDAFDSAHAAIYYPWVTVAGSPPIMLPPSGAVCGIYARTDAQKGVWKAPADQAIQGIIGLQHDVTLREQGDLNPLGINCLRRFPSRGIRVWGARTLSTDPVWKYVSVRRYFLYLEESLARGTQWAVFEPNGTALWANVRATIGDFLYAEWQRGAILGAKPAQAYFMKCDRSTMTQADLDNGRLVCEIGIAPVRPAEFVIFRIGQWTADAVTGC